MISVGLKRVSNIHDLIRKANAKYKEGGLDIEVTHLFGKDTFGVCVSVKNNGFFDTFNAAYLDIDVNVNCPLCAGLKQICAYAEDSLKN